MDEIAEGKLEAAEEKQKKKRKQRPIISTLEIQGNEPQGQKTLQRNERKQQKQHEAWRG